MRIILVNFTHKPRRAQKHGY